jgi:hypothetical protein
MGTGTILKCDRCEYTKTKLFGTGFSGIPVPEPLSFHFPEFEYKELNRLIELSDRSLAERLGTQHQHSRCPRCHFGEVVLGGSFRWD